MKIPMPASMLATSLLIAGMSVPAFAQMTPPSPPANMPMATDAPPTPPAPQPPVSEPPAADPNAGMPTGAPPPSAAGMQPADPAVPVNPTAPVGSPDNPAVIGGNMTAPPPAPKDYPKCSKTITDSCVNPGEARKMRRR